jgi:hypothetical protein
VVAVAVIDVRAVVRALRSQPGMGNLRVGENIDGGWDHRHVWIRLVDVRIDESGELVAKHGLPQREFARERAGTTEEAPAIVRRLLEEGLTLEGAA